MTKEIEIFTCGGTIDKDYGSGKGVYDFHIGRPCVGDILRELHISDEEYQQAELMREDSLDMTNNHRQNIHHRVEISTAGKIFITHGTDTMDLTGNILSDIRDKIIVIVGASRPYSMKVTDAVENVKYAWGKLQEESIPGVYIAMNKQLIPSNRVHKLDDGTFIDSRYINIGDIPMYEGYYHVGNGVLKENR